MKKVAADQSANVEITYRKGEGRPITITCVDEDGDEFDLSGFEFELDVYNGYDKETNLIHLTQDSGGGLVNGGATGILTIDPEDNDLNLDEGSYEWRLRPVSPELNTWFNGAWKINNTPKPSDIASNIQVTINTGAVNITATIALGGSGGGGTDFFRGEVWDFAEGTPAVSTDVGRLPVDADDVGSKQNGDIQEGDFFIHPLDADMAVIEGVEIHPGTWFFAAQDSPTQLSHWRYR